MEINNVKGTHDVFAGEAAAYSQVEALMKNIAELFAFMEVRPPVIEHSEVFVRGVGESSDVVRKEMYTFLDKGKRSLTLRPEFTAGIIRMMVQNKLLFTSELPLKVYYNGPVFRYERPQLGRYRQFNQFGVESVGSNSPLCDLEVMVLAYTILTSLGLENVTIKINTLGDEASRDAYRQALKEYFKDSVAKMCPDCQSRYEMNPLRILDCKVPEDQAIVKGAPKIDQYLSEASKERFKIITEYLDSFAIPYEFDNTLVRGLDYYSETVFEFHYVSEKGNDYGAIGGGGHYDKLVKELGGPDMPGIGFSFGIERIVSILRDNNLIPDDIPAFELSFYVIPVGGKAQLMAHTLATNIRLLGYSADICFDDIKLAAMFKRAEKKGAKYAIIIGEDEINKHKVIIKNLVSKEQIVVVQEDFEDKIVEIMEDDSHHCSCGCHDGDDCDCHDEDCDCDCHDGSCQCHDEDCECHKENK
ncbi:MAG TPA: histidine--tRNA ligase [Bacilli bacterium]|nr:histidine--tRNA ligase [Bacilli bacterium]HPS19166.1 histidine--tRNA ligase [Bacilli bacterium]